MRIATSSAGNERGARRQTGFTLLELMLVLALLGLMLALVPPALSGRVETLGLRAAARELAGTLQQARGTALAQGRPVSLRLHADGRYRVEPAGPERRLPEGVVLAAAPGAAEWSQAPVAGRLEPLPPQGLALTLFPDGSASGALLALSRDGDGYRIELDWLLGRVVLSREAADGG